MRVILAAAAALAVVTVSGCDINTGPAKTAKVDCNCTAPATPAPPAGMRGDADYTPPATHDRYRFHRHPHATARWGGHSYAWRREYAELSVATYDYHSDSHSYDTSGGGDTSGASAYAYAAAGAYAGGGAYAGAHGGGYGGDAVHGGDGYRAAPHGWVDGYGRGHDGGDATAGAPVHDESGGHGRGDPWHGYDVDCPDKGPRR